MDTNEVLKRYIESCSSAFFQYCLAKNAILEWFGRTIRGRHKIYQYFRYDLCQEYEHNFYNAHSCEPIEIRPAHYETREIVNDNFNSVNTTIKSNTFETTPIQFGIIPELPKLNRGLNFINDTNEKELDELGLSTIHDSIATPPQQLHIEGNTDEPPIKKIKHSTRIHSDVNIEEFSAKSNIDEDKNLHDLQKNCNLKSDNNDINTEYSPLMYLEVNGTLRSPNRLKHRGVQTPTTSNINLNNDDLNISNESLQNSSSYWDRDTKLKISYRIRLSDKQIEFALIIYEHIISKPTTKRNLLSEFDETIKDNNTNELIRNESISHKNIPSELKRKKPLKRSLRFF